MPAQTSGGLYKRSHQFNRETLDAVQTVAREKGISESAAVRELLTLGWRVYQRRKAVATPVEDLAVEVVARDVA